MSLDWTEVINLPKIELDIERYKTIKNGQLLPRKMFSNEESCIISIDKNIVAIYKPFNENYYKPEKLVVRENIKILLLIILLMMKFQLFVSVVLMAYI